MIQYIDKVAVETELQRRLKSYKEEIKKYGPFQHNLVIDIIGKKEECNDILSFINALEAKEIDLNLEITLWANAIPEIQLNDVERLAKYFFELGLQAKSKII